MQAASPNWRASLGPSPLESLRQASLEQHREQPLVRSGRFQVGGRLLAGPLVSLGVVADFLAFVKTANAGAFDGGDMNEDVFAASIRLNETIAFLGVKPLH